MQFGCFVQLEGLRGRHEGLVHISQVSVSNDVAMDLCTTFDTLFVCHSYVVRVVWQMLET